jgi:hypothetical protein
MLTDAQRERVRIATRTLQIIVGALLFGAATFLGVAVYFVSQKPPAAAPAEPIFTYIAIGMIFIEGITWVILPKIMASSARQALIEGRTLAWAQDRSVTNAAELGDVATITASYMTLTIVGVALLEGATFLAIFAYLQEHRPIALYAAVALLLLIATQFPTMSRVETWVEGELTTIQQLRQMR